jgi:hypothetical protein
MATNPDDVSIDVEALVADVLAHPDNYEIETVHLARWASDRALEAADLEQRAAKLRAEVGAVGAQLTKRQDIVIRPAGVENQPVPVKRTTDEALQMLREAGLL